MWERCRWGGSLSDDNVGLATFDAALSSHRSGRSHQLRLVERGEARRE